MLRSNRNDRRKRVCATCNKPNHICARKYHYSSLTGMTVNGTAPLISVPAQTVSEYLTDLREEVRKISSPVRFFTTEYVYIPRSPRYYGCITFTRTQYYRRCQRHFITGYDQDEIYDNTVQQDQLEQFLFNFKQAISSTGSVEQLRFYAYVLVHILARRDRTRHYCYRGSEAQIVHNGTPMYWVCFGCARAIRGAN